MFSLLYKYSEYLYPIELFLSRSYGFFNFYQTQKLNWKNDLIINESILEIKLSNGFNPINKF